MAKKMKLTKSDGTVVFVGKPIDLPIKKDHIKKMSISLFNDPEPCVIHESYAVSKLTLDITNVLKGLKSKVKLNGLGLDLSYIEIESLNELMIEAIK